MIELRKARPEDLALIAQTYTRGAHRALFSHEQLDQDEWEDVALRFVSECAKAGHILIAGDKASDIIAGYAMGYRSADGAVLHWVQTIGLYKGHGVARTLVDALTRDLVDVVVTHTCSRRHRRAIQSRGWQFSGRSPWLWLLTAEKRQICKS